MLIINTNTDETSIQVVSPLSTIPTICSMLGALIGPAASCAQSGSAASVGTASAPNSPSFLMMFIL